MVSRDAQLEDTFDSGNKAMRIREVNESTDGTDDNKDSDKYMNERASSKMLIDEQTTTMEATATFASTATAIAAAECRVRTGVQTSLTDTFA